MPRKKWTHRAGGFQRHRPLVLPFGTSPRKRGPRGRASRRAGNLFDQKHDPALGAFGNLNLIAGFPDQVRDIDHRQRVRAVNFQQGAGREGGAML